jgi:hypothetical protein
MEAVEQRHKDPFTGYRYEDGESQAKKEYIPVTFLFRKIVLQIVADKSTGEGHQGIGYYAIGEGNAQAESKPHEEDGLQEGPNEPPADEDEEELSDG